MVYLFTIPNSNHTFASLFSDIAKKQQSFVNQNNLTPNDTHRIDCNLRNILKSKLINLTNIKINNEAIDKLLKTTGNIYKNSGNKIFKVKISYSSIIENGIKIVDLPNTSGAWAIQNISLTPKSSRLQIIISNKWVSVKFLLNWKNNYEFNGFKYGAKLGLGSPSWNVWVSKKKS